MKLKAVIIYNNQERVFFIPCGEGDKSFKWLGIVASQRYATATPNGSLRRREDFCAMSEKSQYQTLNILLPSGNSPHPAEMIRDYLREGDTVTITLCNRLNINAVTGAPHTSSWVSLAYSTSTENLSPYNSMNRDPEPGFQSEEEQSEEKISLDRELQRTNKSNAEFMRIILESQLVNTRKIEHQVAERWQRVSKAIPLLSGAEAPRIQQIFVDNWGTLLDLFSHYGPEGHLPREDFLALMEESEVFHAVHSAEQSAKIYSRTCKYLSVDSDAFNVSCMMVALLLCAQSKFNDTLITAPHSRVSFEALSEIFQKNLAPLARRLQLHSTLKEDFVSDECLSKVRGLYLELQAIFDKSAAKYRDIPSTIPHEDLSEIFVECRLLDSKEAHKVKIWHEDVRRGLINGRSVEMAPVRDRSNSNSDELPAEDELTFPEFIEVISRAGHFRFYNREVGADADGPDAPRLVDCYVKGFVAVVEGSNNSLIPKVVVPVEKKQTRSKK